MKHIVILGGSYGGISTAHRLLKQAGSTALFKITLVCPNTHFYWNMASPRAVVPGQLSDEKVFQPIAAGFSRFPASKFELIQAYAETLDVDARKVGISGPTGSAMLEYDFLILATGSQTIGNTPFKMLGTTEATKEVLHDFQKRVKKAKTIVVAGAGITGVEISGELAFEYGARKEIILIASGPTILEGSPASVSKLATKELKNLKVEIKLQKRVEASAQMPNGQHEITLSGGHKLVADMYVPAFGVAPNSSYVPAKFLNAQGFVMVDEYLKMKGAKNVWAIGDVSDIEPAQFKVTDTQSAHLSKNIVSILSNKTPLPYKVATRMRHVFFKLKLR